MKALAAAIRYDFLIQLRQGFLHAAAFAAGLLCLLLVWLPGYQRAFLLPLVFFGNLLMNCFYFVAGLLLLEKSQGALDALGVSPLGLPRYLGAKFATLTALGLAESGLLTLALAPGPVHAAPLLAGLLLCSLLFVLSGFWAAIRYDSVNAFLFPSVFYTAVLVLPLFHYLGLWSMPWAAWHPVSGAWLLLRAGFEPCQAAPLAASAAWSLLWAIPLAWLCERSYRREMGQR